MILSASRAGLAHHPRFACGFAAKVTNGVPLTIMPIPFLGGWERRPMKFT